jgi:hypothetical protein
MGEFLGSVIIELLLAMPGAYILAILLRRRGQSREMMNDHYVMSMFTGMAAWALVISSIKFAMYGCVLCN